MVIIIFSIISSTDTEELCDYEVRRLENIRRNKEILSSLGLVNEEVCPEIHYGYIL